MTSQISDDSGASPTPGGASPAFGDGSTPGGSPDPDGTPWPALVTAALLGAERREPPGGSVTALLDRAAVSTVRRRAALTPAPSRPQPSRTEADARPALPPAAAARCTELLDAALRTGYESSGAARIRIDFGALLPEWLTLAVEAGYRPNPEQLPALLNAARARTDLRAVALAFGGPRARWLAALNPRWSFALREPALATRSAGSGQGTGGPGSTATAGPPSHADPERLWAEGLFTERVTLLAQLRQRDPERGRRLLESTWSSERAEDRLMFLDTLGDGLSPADEPFLEAALADRSKTVRATANELLSRLPQSAMGARMAARVRTCVTLESSGEHASLAVRPPSECDAEMRRDGVERKPPVGHGERSWWLTQLVEAAPLGMWSAHCGGLSPAEIVALPASDSWRTDLHVAWSRAAVRQRDTAWARALLGRPDAPVAETPERAARLLTLLPDAERADWAARFVAAQGLNDAFRVLNSCGGPWPEPLAEVVFDALANATTAKGGYPTEISGVLSLAERALDPEEGSRLVARIAPLAARRHGRQTLYWERGFNQLGEVLRLRATMREELGEGSATPG